MEAYRKSVAACEKDQESSSLLMSPVKAAELKETAVCLSAQNTHESTTSNSSPVKSLEKSDVCTSVHDEAIAEPPTHEEVKEGESKTEVPLESQPSE